MVSGPQKLGKHHDLTEFLIIFPMKIPIILKGYRNPIQWLFRSCFLLNVASLVELHTSASASAPGGRRVCRIICEDDDCRGDSSRLSQGEKFWSFGSKSEKNAELGLSTTR